MMGPKTLSTIREELRAALAETGKDPIQWLEDRIQLLEKAKKPDHKEIELLRGLGRVLANAAKPKANVPARSKAKRQVG
jgi:hypothetical protein